MAKDDQAGANQDQQGSDAADEDAEDDDADDESQEEKQDDHCDDADGEEDLPILQGISTPRLNRRQAKMAAFSSLLSQTVARRTGPELSSSTAFAKWFHNSRTFHTGHPIL